MINLRPNPIQALCSQNKHFCAARFFTASGERPGVHESALGMPAGIGKSAQGMGGTWGRMGWRWGKEEGRSGLGWAILVAATHTNALTPFSALIP